MIASTGKKKRTGEKFLLPLTELDWYNEYKEVTGQGGLSQPLVSAASKVLTRPFIMRLYYTWASANSSLPNLPPPFCFLCSCQLIFLQFAHILPFLFFPQLLHFFPMIMFIFLIKIIYLFIYFDHAPQHVGS